MDGRRYCYYLTPTMLTPEGYLPVVVIEGCAGYGPPSGQPHPDRRFGAATWPPQSSASTRPTPGSGSALSRPGESR